MQFHLFYKQPFLKRLVLKFRRGIGNCLRTVGYFNGARSDGGLPLFIPPHCSAAATALPLLPPGPFLPIPSTMLTCHWIFEDALASWTKSNHSEDQTQPRQQVTNAWFREISTNDIKLILLSKDLVPNSVTIYMCYRGWGFFFVMKRLLDKRHWKMLINSEYNAGCYSGVITITYSVKENI